MPDIPGNSSTTASVTVGGSVYGSLETIGDHDWFRLNLTAGQAISITLDGLSLEDPYLRIYDSAGNLLFENDDGGAGRDSLLNFTANYTGTYFIDVGAWDEGYVGDYQLIVAPYVPPAVWTNDQIANQLTHGYWDGSAHHFNVSPGGTLTVNITALTPAGQNLAREALALWSDVIGVNFQYVLTGGQIRFDDNEEGAHADASWSGTITSSANVNVSAEWLTTYGTGLNGYAFQTYIHEIGHALGLGHAGNYNGEATYSTDILYRNDGWPATIMSYFDQSENTYFNDQGFTRQFVMTPMVADIVAMSNLYGLSTTTRTGDTVYGFNSNANRSVFNAVTFAKASYTVIDSAGTDTLDYSGYAGSQRIDLNPETFSNVLGLIGNVSIARGTIIENATGGAGNDILVGNAAGNVLTGGNGADVLTGGAGSDSFRDSAAGLNGDIITDFSAGDRIIIRDASSSNFIFSVSGSTLNFTGGTLTLTGFAGQLAASAAAGGGVQLTIGQAQASSNDARNDFNGDGRSDVLWRHSSGELTNWLATGNGGFADNSLALTRMVPADWRVAEAGDFNGDGRDDILWRNSNGAVTDWLATASGGFADNDGAFFRIVANDWQIAGTGDFNGDGRDDILWRHTNGTVTDWLASANGAFTDNVGAIFRQIGNDWQIADVGDFNGDGRDDILWRHTNGTVTDWLGTANGGFAENAGAFFRQIGNDWQIEGTGDFNGDGRDDILWRHANGTVTDWLGTANGGFADNAGAIFRPVGGAWQIAATGDYNGDGRDDILWRDSNGTVTDWLGTANGGFVDNDQAIYRPVSLAWNVQDGDYLMG